MHSDHFGAHQCGGISPEEEVKRMGWVVDMCEMTGKWNPFENRADKNASALKTALNTTVGKLCLFSSNRVNPDHRHGSNAAIYGIASHSRIHDKRSFVSNGEKKR